MKDHVKVIAVAVAIFIYGAVAAHVCGCSTAQKQAEADAAYATEHLNCVDKYNTKPEIDACRASVRTRWGIAQTTKDAGADHD